ncbi:MAG: pyridoxamine 5'-phosphate oxidase family protein, partial [Planctomycetota bacterium]
MSNTADWRDELREAWAQTDGPRLLALATIARPGQPAVRMLVVRRFEEGGDLLMCTDTRSHKWDELDESVNVEGLVWAETVRKQFRLAGACVVEKDAATRREIWQ